MSALSVLVDYIGIILITTAHENRICGWFFLPIVLRRNDLVRCGSLTRHLSLGLIDIDLSPPLQESGINPKFTTVLPL